MTINLEFDLKFWQEGIRFLCGIDEAGRGPLAGPVVAAAVILPAKCEIAGVNDSKKLSAAQREKLAIVIKQQALSYGVGQASVEEIDRLNILQATFLAMKRAVDQLELMPEYLLVDGRDFPRFTYRQSVTPLRGQPIIRGDEKFLSIAAASILAKVHRDQIMRENAAFYPAYGFEKHKGYGTEEHRRKIREFGPCPLHRHSFLKKIIAEKIIDKPLIA